MEENNEDKNIYTYKIILIGDSFVGKSKDSATSSDKINAK